MKRKKIGKGVYLETGVFTDGDGEKFQFEKVPSIILAETSLEEGLMVILEYEEKHPDPNGRKGIGGDCIPMEAEPEGSK